PHPGRAQARPGWGEGAPRASGKTERLLTWLALEPLTGRTHQLRVHCAAMGWPIVSDAIYGTASRNAGTVLHLHARDVVIPLYKTRARIRVVAPVPPHMRAALSQCGWRDDDFVLPRETGEGDHPNDGGRGVGGE